VFLSTAPRQSPHTTDRNRPGAPYAQAGFISLISGNRSIGVVKTWVTRRLFSFFFFELVLLGRLMATLICQVRPCEHE